MRLPLAIRPGLTALIAGALAALALGAPRRARAHEYWLTAAPGTPHTHEPVQVGALAGTGFRGERKPFSSLLCVRLVAQAAQPLDLTRVAASGEYVWARFAPSDGGGVMFGYQSDFSPIELPGPQFDAYLALEGLDAPLTTRRRSHCDAPGRERYRRCAKTWLDGSDATRATKPIGFPLEIVPLDRPGAASVLRLRIDLDGHPRAGALVRAWHSPLAAGGMPLDPAKRDSVGESWQGRSDSRGEVAIPVRARGEWLVSVVHMQTCPDPVVADWESTWASLMFTRDHEESAH